MAALLDADERGEISDDTFDDELWSFLVERIEVPEDAVRFSEPVLVYFASRYMEWEVGNGGFAQAAYNIPEWFEPAAWAYDRLGLPEASALIWKAIPMLRKENRFTTFTATYIGGLFKQFSESKLAMLDDRLDDVGWWAEGERLRFVRGNRNAFRSVA